MNVKPYLSRNEKRAVFAAFTELKEEVMSYNRINFVYGASKQRRKVLATQLSKTGNGYVSGLGLEKEYNVDPRGWIKIKDFTEEELKAVIQKALFQMSNGRG